MFIYAISQIRKKQNMSIYKLNQLTGISRAFLSNLEKDQPRNISLDKLTKIADALNVNVKELFYTTLDLKLLKSELYSRIDTYGLVSDEVLEISHLIDLLINIDMQNKFS